jgi:hypothetical protein
MTRVLIPVLIPGLITVMAMATALGGVGPVFTGGSAFAEDAAPDLTVEAGVRTWFDPGDHVVLTATIEAESLFSGSVEVTAFDSAIVAQSVDVAGGTTKTVRLVVPTSSQFVDDNGLEVRLVRGNDAVVSKTVRLKAAEQVEIVGVLPAMATRTGKLPEQVKLASDTGTAQVIALPVEVVALGAAALEVYDTIAATTADLSTLQPPARSAVLAWLNRGGRLLLDDAADLSALPDGWRPGAAGYALAGRGEVRIVAGAISEGQWSTLIEPSGSSISEGGIFFGAEMLGSVQSDLARRAGVKLPSMMPIIVPLIVYCLLVSLGLFVLLKLARRMTLAWVAIPVLAAVTATAIVIAGNGWRQVGDPAASGFVEGYPGGGEARLSMLTFSRDGGTARVQLPTNWYGAIDPNVFFGGGNALIPRIRTSGSGTEVSVRLDAGQVTTATVSGPTADVGLAVTARVQGDDVVGTVTNQSPTMLYQVAVFAPGGAQNIGDLAPGASQEFAVDADTLPPGFALGDRAWTFSLLNPEETTRQLPEAGVWGMASQSLILYPSGMVRAAGWTEERPADGVGLATRTVVTSLTSTQPGAGPLSPAAVRSHAVRSPFGMFGNGLGDQVERFVVPAGTGSQPLVLEVPLGFGQIELWNGTAWIKAPAVKRLARVPTSAIRAGVVLARVSPDLNGFVDPNQRLVLRGLTAEDQA